MKKKLSFLLLFLPLSLFAHGAHGSGFMAGFTHPILGVDHNIALVGTGILGYLLNQKQWYLYPLAFITLMAIGGFLGIGQTATLGIEKFIAFSVLAIGLMIGWPLSFGKIATLIILALFGFTHGYAHGAEMPADTTALKYISGFVVGASLLTILGWSIHLFVQKQTNTDRLITLIGGALMGAGLLMLL